MLPQQIKLGYHNNVTEVTADVMPLLCFPTQDPMHEPRVEVHLRQPEHSKSESRPKGTHLGAQPLQQRQQDPVIPLQHHHQGVYATTRVVSFT